MATTQEGGGLFITKPVDALVADTEDSEHKLERAVGALDLTALGLGAIIGTGIFVVIGEAIGDAGPGDHPVLRPRRRDVRLLGARLRRAGLHHPGRRQRVHVLLRDHGRARGLDHRLGPDPRVRRLGGRRRGRLGGVLQRACSSRCSASPCPSRSPARRARAARSTCRPSSSCCSSPRCCAWASARARGPTPHGRHQAAVLALFLGLGVTGVHGGQPGAVRAERRRRRGHGGLGDLLRLHRLRRGLDVGEETQEPRARPADRDRRLAGDRDAALHRSSRSWPSVRSRPAARRRRGAARHRADEGAGFAGRQRHLLRRARGDHQRDADHPLRPDADHVRDVPRRPDAAPLGLRHPRRARRSASPPRSAS